MSLAVEILGGGGADIDFGTVGCRFDAGELTELHVQLAFCLLGREFAGRTGKYPRVYVRVGDSPNSVRIATDNMAFEISRDDAGELLVRLEGAEVAGHSAQEAAKPDPGGHEWQILGSVTPETLANLQDCNAGENDHADR